LTTGVTGTRRQPVGSQDAITSRGESKMFKNKMIDDWLNDWQVKIATAWRLGDTEEEEWLRLEMENKLRASEKPHIQRSESETPNHTDEGA